MCVNSEILDFELSSHVFKQNLVILVQNWCLILRTFLPFPSINHHTAESPLIPPSVHRLLANTASTPIPLPKSQIGFFFVIIFRVLSPAIAEYRRFFVSSEVGGIGRDDCNIIMMTISQIVGGQTVLLWRFLPKTIFHLISLVDTHTKLLSLCCNFENCCHALFWPRPFLKWAKF